MKLPHFQFWLAAVAGVAAAALAPAALAGNPLLENKGACDPLIRIYHDRAYLYATHDYSPENKAFKMTDWWVWSSTDLVNWDFESFLRPEDTYYGKPFDQCWATHAISHNGKYYLDAAQGECPEGGFEVRGLRAGSDLKYPNVRGLRPDTTLSLRVACAGAAGGSMEVHSGAPDGELLGTCALGDTDGWTNYRTVETTLHNQARKQDIFLVFRGGPDGGEVCRLAWLCFDTQTQR